MQMEFLATLGETSVFTGRIIGCLCFQACFCFTSPHNMTNHLCFASVCLPLAALSSTPHLITLLDILSTVMEFIGRLISSELPSLHKV